VRPPLLAEALVAAAAPASDYAAVAGDLHEEYVRIVSVQGPKAANRWYWSQTLRSLPSLLSYSRSNVSMARRLRVALISLAVLIMMLVAITAMGMALRSLARVDAIPMYVWLCLNYAGALIFGAVLAWLVRTDGVRVAFFASLFLVMCFVTPALAGNPHSQAPPSAWIELWGAIPVMSFGAGLYQAVRRSITSAK
jgi:hypothetical protein